MNEPQLISLDTAKALKRAGLQWEPAMLDYFAVPERGLDEHRFVLSDILVTLQLLRNRLVVSFQGAPEWALDYLLVSEAVWLPREDQLRYMLETALLAEGSTAVSLSGGIGGYTCEIGLGEARERFQGSSGSEAYAAALLALLERG